MNEETNYQPMVVNGTTYLPMDFGTFMSRAKHYQREAMALGCIPQRVKQVVVRGPLREDLVVCVYLVPVDRIQAFLAMKGPDS